MVGRMGASSRIDISQQPGTAAAREAAARRRETLEGIAAGAIDCQVLIMIATVEPPVARMRLCHALRAFPRWSAASAAGLLRQLKIPEDARLSYLLLPSRSELIDKLADSIALGPRRRPEITPGWPFFGRCEWADSVVR